MALINIYICFLLITLTSQQYDDESEGCQLGYFGNNCEFKCHCKKGLCNSTGGCTPQLCHESYFGPACQYVDMMFDGATLFNPDFFQDHDETTCNQNKQQKTIDITVIDSIILYWMRIYVNSPSVFNDGVPFFQLTIGSNGVCDNRQVFRGSNYIDITCTAIKMQQITLQADFVGSLCSIYFSGGRNVAIKQKATQSSTYDNDEVKAGAGNAVDGSTHNDFDSGESCSRTEMDQKEATWTLTFNFPQHIIEVVIYKENDALLTFRLIAFNAAGDIVHSVNYDKAETSVSITLTPFPQESISSITIQQTDNSTHGVLTLCEVQVWAEQVCPTGNFGFLCEETCKCQESKSCHGATGLCATETRAREPPKPDILIGNNVTIGRVCPNGTYGAKCNLKCSAFCMLPTCDSVTGKCEKCHPNYIGSFCEACKSSQFGPACSQSCPEGCMDACIPTTGNCVKCKHGLTGVKCDKKSFPLVFLIIGTIFCCTGTFLVVTYFLRRQRVKNRVDDDASESSKDGEVTEQSSVSV